MASDQLHEEPVPEPRSDVQSDHNGIRPLYLHVSSVLRKILSCIRLYRKVYKNVRASPYDY